MTPQSKSADLRAELVGHLHGLNPIVSGLNLVALWLSQLNPIDSRAIPLFP